MKFSFSYIKEYHTLTLRKVLGVPYYLNYTVCQTELSIHTTELCSLANFTVEVRLHEPEVQLDEPTN